MNNADQIYRNDLIRAAIVNRDLTKQAFAKEAELNPKTVIKLWDGSTNIELESLIKACKFLGIPMQKVFEPREVEDLAIAG